jgi:signal transduction histidine kinase
MHTEEALYRVVFLAAILLAGILAYFIYVNIKQKNRVFKWQEARIKAEIDTLENDRRRISGDLHDDIGPMLSAIKLHITHIEPSTEKEKKIIEKSGSIIDEVIRRFRDTAYDLYPNTLIRKGLITAVNEFVGKMNAIHPLVIEFTHDGTIELTNESELNLYRIIQEIIHNAIKHSGATRLAILLRRDESHINLIAGDNGRGFSYESNKHHANGLGLMNIQNRVALLNGKLSIKAAPRQGTDYFITIPLENQ